MLAVVGFVAFQWMNDHYNNGTERLETVRLATVDKVARDEIQDRVTALAADGCHARANQLMDLHKKKPLQSEGDIPEDLRADLRLCADRSIFLAYVLGDLRDAGLMPLLARHASSL